MSRITRSLPSKECQFIAWMDIGGSNARAATAIMMPGSHKFEKFSFIKRWPGRDKEDKFYVPAMVAVNRSNPEERKWGWEAEAMQTLRPEEFTIYTGLKRALAGGHGTGGSPTDGGTTSVPDDVSLYFYQEFVSLVKRMGRETHNTVLNFALPTMQLGEAASITYASKIQSLFPERVSIRLVDEPMGAFVGILSQLSEDDEQLISEGCSYLVVDMGSTTTDMAHGLLLKKDPLGFQIATCDSKWVGAAEIDQAVTQTVMRDRAGTQQIADIFLKAVDHCKSDIPTGIAQLSHPGSGLKIPRRIWAACAKAACEANAEIDIKRTDYIISLLMEVQPKPDAILVTGGGSASVTMQRALESALADKSPSTNVFFASDSEENLYGGERNQHVMQGLQIIASNAGCGTPGQAPEDVFLCNHSQDSTADAPKLEPFLLWPKNIDLRSQGSHSFATVFELEPSSNDETAGLDIDLTAYRFKKDETEIQKQHPLERYSRVPVEWLDPIQHFTASLPIDLPQGGKAATVYVFATLDLNNVRLGIVFQSDGQKVDQLEKMRFEEVLEGGLLGARLEPDLAQQHSLQYQEARTVFVADPLKAKELPLPRKRKRQQSNRAQAASNEASPKRPLKKPRRR